MPSMLGRGLVAQGPFADPVELFYPEVSRRGRLRPEFLFGQYGWPRISLGAAPSRTNN